MDTAEKGADTSAGPSSLLVVGVVVAHREAMISRTSWAASSTTLACWRYSQVRRDDPAPQLLMIYRDDAHGSDIDACAVVDGPSSPSARRLSWSSPSLSCGYL